MGLLSHFRIQLSLGRALRNPIYVWHLSTLEQFISSPHLVVVC
jgi:hypothetical protein